MSKTNGALRKTVEQIYWQVQEELYFESLMFDRSRNGSDINLMLLISLIYFFWCQNI